MVARKYSYILLVLVVLKTNRTCLYTFFTEPILPLRKLAYPPSGETTSTPLVNQPATLQTRGMTWIRMMVKLESKLTIATVQNTKTETAIALNSTRANMSINFLI